MLDMKVIQDVLACRRIAVVGASDRKDSFGRAVYEALRDHGYDVVAVHPTAQTVSGDACVPDLGSVEPAPEAVLVMTGRAQAAGVVRACVLHGVPRVWLFKGIGSPGAVSEEAVALCRDHGIDVVEGACPLMFLEPVGVPHRIHRAVRRMKGALPKAA